MSSSAIGKRAHLHVDFFLMEGAEEVMTDAQTAKQFEKTLQQQKALLERSLSATVEQGRAIAIEDTIDPADQAVASYQKELMFSQGTNGRTQLAQVELALERLHEGHYGECLECGEAIGAKRLEALPWTRYCFSCQEKIENGELEVNLSTP
jgi:DnaK suppressor protein